jgi:formylglycine-generating enzyme
VRIDAGTYWMGSEEYYVNEGPVHEESVTPFFIDSYLVTNAEFADFASDTGYLTTAEQGLGSEDFPDHADSDRAPGALGFRCVRDGFGRE